MISKTHMPHKKLKKSQSTECKVFTNSILKKRQSLATSTCGMNDFTKNNSLISNGTLFDKKSHFDTLVKKTIYYKCKFSDFKNVKPTFL